jgi:ketosteroid isomerase-like protein
MKTTLPARALRPAALSGWLLSAILALLAACSATLPVAARPAAAAGVADARSQVMATERAFALTMAERRLESFSSFVADEAVFFSGATPLRGKPAIVAAWARFYQGPQAPFSWEPQDVEVLASGGLAISSGPVRDEAGTLIATFTSIWRLEADGAWRFVFDKGNGACRCAVP